MHSCLQLSTADSTTLVAALLASSLPYVVMNGSMGCHDFFFTSTSPYIILLVACAPPLQMAMHGVRISIENGDCYLLHAAYAPGAWYVVLFLDGMFLLGVEELDTDGLDMDPACAYCINKAFTPHLRRRPCVVSGVKLALILIEYYGTFRSTDYWLGSCVQRRMSGLRTGSGSTRVGL